MPDPRANALMKAVEALLAEKRAVAEKEREFVDGLNRVLTEMGYQVAQRSAGGASGRPRRRRRGRRPGRPSRDASPTATTETPKRRGRPRKARKRKGRPRKS